MRRSSVVERGSHTPEVAGSNPAVRNSCPHPDLRDMGYNTEGVHLMLCRKCNEVLEEKTTLTVASAHARRSMIV
jgi:hypothetical protein